MKTGKLIVGLAVLSLCQTGFPFQDAAASKQSELSRLDAMVKQNKVTVRSKTKEEMDQTVKEMKAFDAERKSLPREERQIEWIGREMSTKFGRSFVGGKPRSVEEAEAQYWAAQRESLESSLRQNESRAEHESQGERIRWIRTLRRVPTGRVFGVHSTAKAEEAEKANACPKCNRGRVKCPACDGTRLVTVAGGAGCAPCTNCTDGSVPCKDCDGKGVVK